MMFHAPDTDYELEELGLATVLFVENEMRWVCHPRGITFYYDGKVHFRTDADDPIYTAVRAFIAQVYAEDAVAA